jgi:sterol desaturase/sphingolipid hydroxylase (fatty acid hydroxylase superfamily)
MSDETLNFPPILIYAVPVFLLTLIVEWALTRRSGQKGRHSLKDSAASLAMGTGNLLTDIAFGAISLALLMTAWRFRLFDLGASVPVILTALIAQDFVYYWKHRASHRIRWFWAAHVVHHSSEHYNLTTALRQPWISHFTGYAVMSIPLVLIGFHPLLIAFVASLNLLYQYWIHTELIDKMPSWFEAVFNTPSHHRVHHAVHPRYLDANYAGIFIIWDKMFGTFVPEDNAEPMEYGVVTPIETYNPLRIAFAEWGQIFKDMFSPHSTAGFWARVKYAAAPPGYSHDGSRQKTEDIKREFMRRHPAQIGTPGLPAHLLDSSKTVK